MKIVFVSFQDNTDIIGVKYLHSYVRSKGYESYILLIPNNYPDSIKAASEYISAAKPDLLGFSAMSYEFQRAKNFASILKDKFNICPIVFGGIHATADPESCLEAADIVVRGEGEETLIEVLKSLEAGAHTDIAEVGGIVFKQKTRVIHTGVRQPIGDLDSLAYPGHLPQEMYVVHGGRIHSIKERGMYKRYARYQGTFLSIATSRGCPFACYYCSNSMLKAYYGKNTIRSRSIDSVIDEINTELREFKEILYVNFTDDCFMMHPLNWIEGFSRRYAKEIKIPFIARSTPRHTDKEKMTLLKDAGLRWVFMGLQTGSDRINKDIYGRHATSEDFLKSARIISELKISPWYDIIVDNPYESESDHLRTIDVLLRTPRPFEVSLFSLDYFPGTELLKRAVQDKVSMPAIGTKSYTKPEFALMNCFIRMSANLPIGLVRSLVKSRNSRIGEIAGMVFYSIALVIEPFMYIYLVYLSNDYRLIRTLRVVKTFYARSIKKLFFRQIA